MVDWHGIRYVCRGSGSVLTLALWIQALLGSGEAPAWYIGFVSLWLWFTGFSSQNFLKLWLKAGKSPGKASPLCDVGHNGKAFTQSQTEVQVLMLSLHPQLQR